jgi:hypothetical protein
VHVEILARRSGDGEGGVGFADKIWCELAANGVEERWAGEPSAYGGQERREEQ